MDLSQKTPFAVTITEYIQNRMDSNQENFGLQLPARVTAINGAIVTVNFEIDTGGSFTFPPVTCAIAESKYVRIPVQVGDYGVCIAADTRLGGINGLGQGLAPLTTPFNLGGLIFVPLGNKDWELVDPNAVNINAPNGAVIRDSNNNCVITLTPTGTTITIGSTKMTITASGVTITGNLTVTGSISASGDVTAGSISLENHVHSGVKAGTDNSGKPV